ncbi:MAG: hypothetical protein P1V81_08445 [Planctomycetota bacterium]|nr:hypothetical protein [Planctomycetota bacterium]
MSTLLLSLVLSASAGASPAAAPVEVPLTFRTFREWDVSLPAEQFLPLGNLLPLFGTDGLAVGVGEGGLSFDRDGDGTFDATVADTDPEHPTRLLTFRLNTDAGVRDFAVRAANQGRWVFAPAGAVEGRIGKTRFLVFDQNGNGRFDDYGQDAMIVGRGKAAGFLSRTVVVDGALKSFSIEPDGSAALISDFAGETGKLDLGVDLETRAKLRSVVLIDEATQNSFELSASLVSEGGLDLPVGKYTLHSGELVLGKSHATLATGRAGAIEVTSGSTTSLAWGGPVKAEFAYQRSGGQLQVGPSDITYFGRAGEQYSDFMPLGSSPQFVVKDRATGETLVDFVFPGNC